MAAGDIIVVNENSFGMKGNYFDGVDDYVLHDAHAIARVAANDTVGTYTAWIYVEDLSAGTVLSAGDNSSGNEYMFLGIVSGLLRVKLNHGGTTQFEVKQTTTSINEKEWTHVAIVQNGTQPILYINGVAVAATNITSTDLTFWYDELTLVDKFAIGVFESNNTHTTDFTGAIGRVRYYSVNLNADEILADMHDRISSEKRATELAAALQFNVTMENDGTTDSGLGADNGTLTGNAHYGCYISNWSRTIAANVTGHAAEFINSLAIGDKILTVIKRGD